MARFRDSEKREWLVGVTVGGVKRVIEKCGVNIAEPLAGDQPFKRRAVIPT